MTALLICFSVSFVRWICAVFVQRVGIATCAEKVLVEIALKGKIAANAAYGSTGTAPAFTVPFADAALMITAEIFASYVAHLLCFTNLAFADTAARPFAIIAISKIRVRIVELLAIGRDRD